MAYLKRITAIGKIMYPSLLWNIPTEEKRLYLTFDDGPIPGITPWVLSLLKEFNAKATFLTIGENVQKNPEIFKEIISEGHGIGNHTFNHLSGWKTSEEEYLKNVFSAEEEMLKNLGSPPLLLSSNSTGKKIFRPPFGRIKPSQIKSLQKLNFKILMWDVISGDFDTGLSPEQCYQNVVELANPGSVIVFHDSLKASTNLRFSLPKVLQYYKDKGYEFKAI